MKKRAEPIVSEIDAEFYKRLCKVVKAGTFKSIDLSPYHKGCDTSIDVSCNWPELEHLMVEWYYNSWELIKMLGHSSLEIVPRIDDEKLIFHLNLDLAYEETEGWDEFAEGTWSP
jgi:hypothetical protein